MAFTVRKEIRKMRFFERFIADFSKSDLFRKKSVFKIDQSEKGFGGIALGSEFIGSGNVISLQDGKDYMVRWVRVHFGFVYRFGLEAI